MKNISARDLARVADYPEQTSDPRRTAYGNIRHKLADIIVIVFTALHRLRKMKMEKKRVSAKRGMMRAALDSGFLYEALFSE